MSYCLNPKCQKPQNPDNAKFCSTCGSKLLLGDRYRAIQVLSQGGIGRTFLAVDEQDATKSHCIIKQLSPSNQGTNNTEKAAELFHQEATRLSELGQHPQIPELLAYFEPDSWKGTTGTALLRGCPAPTLVLTFIEGQSLAQKLEAEGAFSETQIRQILNELLPVLQFVHEKGVIHRDINPENIIRPCTSDLYSLGVTCIHLLTNVHPFDLFNSLEGVWVWEDYLYNPVSDELRQILNKMLESAIKQRYQSAEEILKDLNPQIDPKTLIQSTQTITPSSSMASKALNPTWNCVRTLVGHFSSVTSIAFSPDGEIVASGSADRTVKLWSPTSRIPRASFAGHSSLIDAIAFSPDGRILASGSWDHTIKIWNLETGEDIHTFCEHSGWIKSLTITRYGKHLVSASADRTIKIWNLETREVQTTLCGHEGAVHAVAISPDGRILASGSADKTIKIWDLSSGNAWLTLNGHSDAINSLTFSPSGQILISGSFDKTIKLWKWESNALLNTLNEHSEAVNSVAINTQGNMLVSGSTDKTVKIWHPGSGELLYTLAGHSAGVISVAINPDNRRLASGSQDKTIKIWQFD
jgi:WD40 repeat protein